MASKTQKRSKEILRILLGDGRTGVDDLAARFHTSPASIRRDLARLEEQGLVHRTHGGAMLAGGGTYEPFRFDAAFAEREDRFPREKRRIAQLAAELIREGETIGLTAGTTTTQVARALLGRRDLHIITNAVNIGMELSGNTRLHTVLTGGSMRFPGAGTLTGPAALEALQTVYMDRLLLGVTGVHPRHGVTVIEPEEAAVFRAMARRSRQIVVVADSSKIGMTSPAVICQPQEVHILITDEGISEEAQAALQANGTEVRIATL